MLECVIKINIIIIIKIKVSPHKAIYHISIFNILLKFIHPDEEMQIFVYFNLNFVMNYK